ncbi:MAG: ribose-phosphate pyrophosphokinase [Candidatus Diapherotrites archaeon]|nr:ribose-phosphate pyrophosphokinase [Candidatus Diapherotrites archaeon]
MKYPQITLYSGNSNPSLARKIAEAIVIPLSGVELSQFADGETYCLLPDNVRGQDVYILQSTSKPVNDLLMELLILIDAAKRANANRITVVIPYFGYARQDRKSHGREPITAKLVANLLQTAGANRVITLDLHSGQIQGFFDIPVDNLLPDALFAQAIQSHIDPYTVVVAPDVGATKRCQHFANRIGCELAIITKDRPKTNQAVATNVIGNVKGKTCIIFDDIADTCGTLIAAAQALKIHGAKHVYACITHGLFSQNAIEKFDQSEIEKLFVTDSIAHARLPKNTQIVSVVNLLAKAIENAHTNHSIRSLFE